MVGCGGGETGAQNDDHPTARFSRQNWNRFLLPAGLPGPPGGQAGRDGRVMIKADREAKQQAASRDAGKDSSKKPAGGRTKVRLSHFSLCAAPCGPTVLQAVSGSHAITQIAKLTVC